MGRPINIIVNHRNVVHSQEAYGIVRVDPRTEREVPTENGCEVMTLERQLAHEPGHVILETGDVGPGRMSIVDDVENPIGNELGWPLRTRYERGECE